MRIVAVVQARMGSTRLPGKVLKDLAGRPMIAHVLERVRGIEGVDDVWVATSALPLDDPLVRQVEASGLATVFRGSELDVLGRFAGATLAARADVVVRITADCPLLCPSVSARVVRRLSEPSVCDYASNSLTRTYPRGLDTEAFTVEALVEAAQNASEAWDREHVTPFIYRHPDRFSICQVYDSEDHSSHRWTVDTAEDFELVRRIYAELWRPDRPVFEYDEILACLAGHPDWLSLNQHIQQRQQ
jgi:spore coat polysaccharide biosynthesis protein SpsF